MFIHVRNPWLFSTVLLTVLPSTLNQEQLFHLNDKPIAYRGAYCAE